MKSRGYQADLLIVSLQRLLSAAGSCKINVEVDGLPGLCSYLNHYFPSQRICRDLSSAWKLLGRLRRPRSLWLGLF